MLITSAKTIKHHIYSCVTTYLPIATKLQQRARTLTKSVDISTYFGSKYGNTVLSRKFIDEHFNHYGLKVLGVSEGVICNRQDLVALRKLN